MHILVQDKRTGIEQTIKLDDAAKLMGLAADEIEWALEESVNARARITSQRSQTEGTDQGGALATASLIPGFVSSSHVSLVETRGLRCIAVDPMPECKSTTSSRVNLSELATTWSRPNHPARSDCDVSNATFRRLCFELPFQKTKWRLGRGPVRHWNGFKMHMRYTRASDCSPH
jgi:hypothetical protein